MDERKTTKITLEGEPAKVEATTYESRDTHIARSLKVRRYMHLLLLGEAHQKGETNG